MWINKVGEKIDLKIKNGKSVDKSVLKAALDRSANKMEDTLRSVFGNNTIKGYKPNPATFFAQMIAHEAHHRGQIMMTLTRNNFDLDKSVNFGLWAWNTK